MKIIKQNKCRIIEVPKNVCTIRLIDVNEDDIYISKEEEFMCIQICDKDFPCQQSKHREEVK